MGAAARVFRIVMIKTLGALLGGWGFHMECRFTIRGNCCLCSVCCPELAKLMSVD